MQSIFISIACFHDKDIINTITDCVKKAKYPERLHFGICLQTDDSVWDLESLHSNISIKRIHWKQAQGPTYARYLSNQLVNNEEYFLQIDCHSRFVSEWDEKLYNCWKETVEIADHDKVILSMFPIPVSYMDRIENYPLNVSSPTFKTITLKSIKLTSYQTVNRTPCLTYYLSGAFMFGPIKFIKDVPYDPILTYSYQSIEQQFYAIRLYTHGWDIYKPSLHVLATSYRPTKYGDGIVPPRNYERGIMSWDRVLYYYGLKSLNDIHDDVKECIAKYGLGNVRTLDSFFELHREPDWKNKLKIDKTTFTYRSTNRILDKVLANDKRFEINKNPDFEWDYYKKGNSKLHHYDMRTVNFIDNKKLWFKLIQDMKVKDGIPKTYFSPKDVTTDLSKTRVYLKYATNNGGKNVHLWNNLSDLIHNINPSKPYIIQEEVYPMALIDNKKFVLRNLIIILGDDYYLFIDGTCVVHGTDYDRNSLDRGMNIDHVPTKVQYLKYRDMPFYSLTFPKIKNLLSNLCHKCISSNMKKDSKSYHVLGSDIIFSDNYDPYMIEINAWPNMSANVFKTLNFFEYFTDELIVPYLGDYSITPTNFIKLT